MTITFFPVKPAGHFFKPQKETQQVKPSPTLEFQGSKASPARYLPFTELLEMLSLNPIWDSKGAKLKFNNLFIQKKTLWIEKAFPRASAMVLVPSYLATSKRGPARCSPAEQWPLDAASRNPDTGNTNAAASPLDPAPIQPWLP